MSEEKALAQNKQAKEKLRTQKREEEREKCIEYAMKERDWSREEAISNIRDTRKRIGITFRDYRLFRMARIEPEAQEEAYKDALERRRIRREEREDFFTRIMCGTGLNRERAEEEFLKVQEKTGCTLKEYLRYRFWALSSDEINSLYLQKQHRALLRRYQYDAVIKRIVESKELTNQYFSEFISRPWCVNEEISREDFKQLFSCSSGVVYKPVFGLQGRGVEAFRFTENSIDKVYDILTAYERGVVEEFITQNDVLNRFNASSVNTVRFYSVSSSKKAVTADGKYADIATATVKLGGSNSVVDNLHAGHGVCAAVDLQTGIILSNGIDWIGNAYAMLELMGLAEFADKKVYELSGGMRQRVSIGRTLINDPEILLMDEPFSALDALTREQLQDALRSLWMHQKNTIFFITHDIDEALVLGTRIIVLSSRPGRIVKDMSIDYTNKIYEAGNSRRVLGEDYFALRRELFDLISAH